MGQPLDSPIGFGASDFVELAAAVLLVLLVLVRPGLERPARRLAERTGWCMLFLGVLPIALRLALLPSYPVPTAGVADDFSYLLLSDTLSHLRLANPPHPLHQFFETLFVLQEPAYSSPFPLGQGIVLALGRMIFGHPWAGVALSVGAFCALCYWMLRAWTAPTWALVGGVLAALQFGPLNQWMNSYWGGAVAATAGCLVFGSLPRLREAGRTRDAVWLGLGLAIHVLTRQYESIFLVLSVILFFLPAPRALARAAPVAILLILPAVALTLLQNRQVTGSWTTLPNSLSRFQYGVPAAFTVQPNPVPHRDLTREQDLDYRVQSALHGDGTDSFGSYMRRLGIRVRFYRFFFIAPLYLVLPLFFVTVHEFRFGWVLVTLLLFGLGANFYPYFYSHYIAAAACLFVLVSVTGLERLGKFSPDAARLILFLCFAHFLFWYGVHLFAGRDYSLAIRRYETWDAINQGDPEGRISINHQLAQAPGKQLVLLRYGLRHTFNEWVYNAADIDAARVVWARDLGPEENQKLLGYYPDRNAWLLEPDFRPPRLNPYPR